MQWESNFKFKQFRKFGTKNDKILGHESVDNGNDRNYSKISRATILLSYHSFLVNIWHIRNMPYINLIRNFNFLVVSFVPGSISWAPGCVAWQPGAQEIQYTGSHCWLPVYCISSCICMCCIWLPPVTLIKIANLVTTALPCYPAVLCDPGSTFFTSRTFWPQTVLCNPPLSLLRPLATPCCPSFRCVTLKYKWWSPGCEPHDLLLILVTPSVPWGFLLYVTSLWPLTQSCDHAPAVPCDVPVMYLATRAIYCDRQLYRVSPRCSFWPIGLFFYPLPYVYCEPCSCTRRRCWRCCRAPRRTAAPRARSPISLEGTRSRRGKNTVTDIWYGGNTLLQTSAWAKCSCRKSWKKVTLRHPIKV